jgi:hypothetical protein
VWRAAGGAGPHAGAGERPVRCSAARAGRAGGHSKQPGVLALSTALLELAQADATPPSLLKEKALEQLMALAIWGMVKPSARAAGRVRVRGHPAGPARSCGRA